MYYKLKAVCLDKYIPILMVLIFISAEPVISQTSIKDIRFGSTGNPLNGLTIAWNSRGTSDRISWGYTMAFEKGEFAAVKSNSITGTRFELKFPSLFAGATIHYKLFDSKNSVWTGVQTYKVASDASNDKVSFTVLGDSRSYPEEWGVISSAVLDTDFTLFMGDIVNDGKDAPDWEAWFDYGENFISRELIYHCVGNHDDDNSSSGFDNFLGLYTQPGNELYYSFTYGNALFICLNTEKPDDPDQYNWLISTLQDNLNKTWKILFFHKPFYTSPSHSGEMDSYFHTFWKAFDDYGVDMIFNGHTHNYQRTKPINRNVSTNSGVETYGSGEGQGRCQIVAGNAGAPLSGAASSSLWWLDNSKSKRHFCNIDIDGNKLTMKALDANQVVFDELEIEKELTSTSNIENTSCTIFPNPSDGVFSIKSHGEEIHGYRIFNSTGQIIFDVSDCRSQSGQMRIDISDQVDGIYYVEIINSAGISFEKLIIN